MSEYGSGSPSDTYEATTKMFNKNPETWCNMNTSYTQRRRKVYTSNTYKQNAKLPKSIPKNPIRTGRGLSEKKFLGGEKKVLIPIIIIMLIINAVQYLIFTFALFFRSILNIRIPYMFCISMVIWFIEEAISILSIIQARYPILNWMWVVFHTIIGVALLFIFNDTLHPVCILFISMFVLFFIGSTIAIRIITGRIIIWTQTLIPVTMTFISGVIVYTYLFRTTFHTYPELWLIVIVLLFLANIVLVFYVISRVMTDVMTKQTSSTLVSSTASITKILILEFIISIVFAMILRDHGFFLIPPVQII